MNATDLLAELRRYHEEIGPRRCPECLQEIDEQPHLPECPWRWILEAE